MLICVIKYNTFATGPEKDRSDGRRGHVIHREILVYLFFLVGLLNVDVIITDRKESKTQCLLIINLG